MKALFQVPKNTVLSDGTSIMLAHGKKTPGPEQPGYQMVFILGGQTLFP